MDLNQRKLTKAEWASIEVPVESSEMSIIKLIQAGYHDVLVRQNKTQSLLGYLKISPSPMIDTYVYVHYLQRRVVSILKKAEPVMKIDFEAEPDETLIKNMKKSDLIRFTNTDKQIQDHHLHMFEFILAFGTP